MKTTFRFAILVTAIMSVLLWTGETFAVEFEDHPLITRYPGSTASRKDHHKFDVYKLVTHIEEGKLAGEELEGEVTRIGYYQPRDRSTLEIFRNYEQALLEVGAEMIFTCANEECGRDSWSAFNKISTMGAGSRYLAAKIETEEAVSYVAIGIGRHRHQIDVVEVKRMETGLVTVNAEALKKGIEKEGRVSVYGIYFDIGKATLKPESKPALDEIAKLMKESPDLKIYVVGHTDNTGGFDLNMNLSRERAQTVVKKLADDYGVNPARMSGHGVGPLCPDSTNRSDTGRGKNRRVDLVEQ